MRNNWEIRPFEQCIKKVKYTAKIPRQDFKESGRYPIISQEESFINGFWDDPGDVFHVTEPVVIFGDHTRHLKYIDFDFVLGADGVKILSPVKDINAKYFYYYLQWLNIPSLGYSRHFKLLKENHIKVAPAKTQLKITTELDILSRVIEKKEHQLREFDSFSRSLFYEKFGDPILNDKNWPICLLGDLCDDVRYGTSRPSSSSGKYMYLRMNNLTYEGDIDLSSVKYIDVPDNEIDKCVVRKGDILFNRTNSRDLIGKTALFDFDEDMVIAGYIIRVRVDESRVSPRFLVSLMNMPSIKSLLRSMAKGAVNQSNINSTELQSILIPCPPLEYQNDFSAYYDQIMKQKKAISSSLEELRTLLNCRMDYYFKS